MSTNHWRDPAAVGPPKALPPPSPHPKPHPGPEPHPGPPPVPGQMRTEGHEPDMHCQYALLSTCGDEARAALERSLGVDADEVIEVYRRRQFERSMRGGRGGGRGGRGRGGGRGGGRGRGGRAPYREGGDDFGGGAVEADLGGGGAGEPAGVESALFE